jgi:hypothetical protein
MPTNQADAEIARLLRQHAQDAAPRRKRRRQATTWS